MATENFKNQDLTGTIFDGQDLSGSLFRGAILTNCSFVDCILDGSNFRDTIIDGANFSRAQMFNCNMKDHVGVAIWTDAKMNGVPAFTEFEGADNISTPSIDKNVVDALFIESAVQTDNFELEDIVNEKDKAEIRSWSPGLVPIVLVGNYPLVSPGRDLYNNISMPSGTLLPWEEIINRSVAINTTFDYNRNRFVVVEETGNRRNLS